MSGDASRPGKEPVSGAKLPSGRKTHMLWEVTLLAPGPAPAGGGGGVPAAHCPEEPPPAALGAGSRSVLLLLLFRCGRGRLVLNPEAFREEADDGPVQVLVQGSTVEVMAFVRVDL